MTDQDFRSLLQALDEARRYIAGEDTGCVVHAAIDFGDYLPDEELEVIFEADFCIDKLPEECPDECGAIVIDEADYGDE